MPSHNKNDNARIIPSECVYSPYRHSQKDSVKMNKIKNDAYDPELDDETIKKIVGVKDDEEIFRKFKDLRINYQFNPTFSEKLDDRKLWRLSCMYNKDIVKIKDHILWDQANDLMAQINKGYI
jgi:hypothetical protein